MKQTNKNGSRLRGHRALMKPFSSPQAQYESLAIDLSSGLMCYFSKMSNYGGLSQTNIQATYTSQYTIVHKSQYTKTGILQHMYHIPTSHVTYQRTALVVKSDSISLAAYKEIWKVCVSSRNRNDTRPFLFFFFFF